MKVFLTGASGFIGANLLRALIERGEEVHALLRPESKEWRLSGIKNSFHRHDVSFLAPEALKNLFTEIQPEAVFHLATYGAYPSEKNIREMLQTNVEGAINLMEASRALGVKAFVNTGSSSEYGIKDHPMREDDMLEPTTLYGITKAAASHFASMLGKKEGVPIATLRLFSAYGPFEEKARLIPSVMLGALSGGSIALSSPNNKRDFMFVEDIIEAYFAAARLLGEGKIAGETINIASGKEQSVGDVVRTVLGFEGASGEPAWGEAEGRAYDAAKWVGDMSKAQTLLGWQARHNLEAGLLKTFGWFKANQELYS